jgi:hypothetical protein
VEGCPILEFLNLSNSYFSPKKIIGPQSHSTPSAITDFALVRIAKCCPLLQNLNLSSCDKITDIVIIKIAKCCPMMQILNLSLCQKITDTAVIRIAECCPMLQSLTLDNYPEIREIGYMRVVECCLKLRRLSMSMWYAPDSANTRMHEINSRPKISYAFR